MRLLSTTGALVLASLWGATHADDPTPIHTHVSDLGLSPFSGEIIAMTAFGPDAGEPVWNTRVDVTFTTDGTTPASELLFHVSLQLEGGSGHWSVSGADLGFPEAAGTYSGSLETDHFDGVVSNMTPFPFTPMEVSVQSTTGGLWGTVDELKLSFEIGPRLEVSQTALSVSAQEGQVLELNAGPSAGPGLWYVLLGSMSGTAPGIDLGGVVLPLVPDAYTDLLLSHPNGPLLQNSLGSLNASGEASAQLSLPPKAGGALVGLELHHVFVLVEPSSGAILSASNATPATLVP